MLIDSKELKSWGVQEGGFMPLDAMVRAKNQKSFLLCVRNSLGLAELAEKITSLVVSEHAKVSLNFFYSNGLYGQCLRLKDLIFSSPLAHCIQVETKVEDSKSVRSIEIQPKLLQSDIEGDGTIRRTYQNGVVEVFTQTNDVHRGFRQFPNQIREVGVFSTVNGALNHGYKISPSGIEFLDPQPLAFSKRPDGSRRMICDVEGALTVVDGEIDIDKSSMKYIQRNTSLDDALIEACFQSALGEERGIREVLNHKDFEGHLDSFINRSLSQQGEKLPIVFQFSRRAASDLLEAADKKGLLNIHSLIDPSSRRNIFLEATTEGSSIVCSTDEHASLREFMEKAILSAKKSILLIAPVLKDVAMVCALNKAIKADVHVSVVYDPSKALKLIPRPDEKIALYPRGNPQWLHSKLLVIDGEFVLIGSANMTQTALTCDENLVIGIHSTSAAVAVDQLGTALIKQEPPSEVRHILDLKGSKWTLYFHPIQNVPSQKELISRIDGASRRIFVAMFLFSHPDIIDALCRARAREVDVRVILDKEVRRNLNRETLRQLKKCGIPCGYGTKAGQFHHKVALIDDTLVAGSCNWTKEGFAGKQETMLFVDPIPQNHRPWFELWWRGVENGSTMQTPQPQAV